jgi:hypothetical protein
MKRHGYWLWAPLRGYISEPSLLDCNHPLFIYLSIYLLFQFCSSWFIYYSGIRAYPWQLWVICTIQSHLCSPSATVRTLLLPYDLLSYPYLSAVINLPYTNSASRKICQLFVDQSVPFAEPSIPSAVVRTFRRPYQFEAICCCSYNPLLLVPYYCYLPLFCCYPSIAICTAVVVSNCKLLKTFY